MCVIGLSPPPFLRLNWQTKKDRLKSLSLIPVMVRVTGVEPASLAALDPKSSASANSAIPAKNGGPYRTRTYDRTVMSRVL